jgi:hypothetical protein
VLTLVGLSRVSKGLDRQGGNVKTDARAGVPEASVVTAGVAVAVQNLTLLLSLARTMLLRCGEGAGRSQARGTRAAGATLLARCKARRALKPCNVRTRACRQSEQHAAILSDMASRGGHQNCMSGGELDLVAPTRAVVDPANALCAHAVATWELQGV